MYLLKIRNCLFYYNSPRQFKFAFLLRSVSWLSFDHFCFVLETCSAVMKALLLMWFSHWPPIVWLGWGPCSFKDQTWVFCLQSMHKGFFGWFGGGYRGLSKTGAYSWLCAEGSIITGRLIEHYKIILRSALYKAGTLPAVSLQPSALRYLVLWPFFQLDYLSFWFWKRILYWIQACLDLF